MLSPFVSSEVTCILCNESKPMEYRNHEYSVYQQYWVCPVTGKEFQTNQQQEDALRRLYRAAR